MKRVAQPAFVGARGIDCDTVITDQFAAWLVANEFDFVCRYLGSLSSHEIDGIHAHGLAVMPVCYADQFDPIAAIRSLTAIGMPTSVTVWSDTESIKTLDAPALISRLDLWSRALRVAQFDPGGYFGNDTLLTSLELGHLDIDRYWQSASKIVDRFGHLSEPTLETGPIGWCMKQCCPGNLTHFKGKPTPAWIDIDFIYEDFRGRTPTWCIGIP